MFCLSMNKDVGQRSKVKSFTTRIHEPTQTSRRNRDSEIDEVLTGQVRKLERSRRMFGDGRRPETR